MKYSPIIEGNRFDHSLQKWQSKSAHKIWMRIYIRDEKSNSLQKHQQKFWSAYIEYFHMQITCFSIGISSVSMLGVCSGKLYQTGPAIHKCTKKMMNETCFKLKLNDQLPQHQKTMNEAEHSHAWLIFILDTWSCSGSNDIEGQKTSR